MQISRRSIISATVSGLVYLQRANARAEEAQQESSSNKEVKEVSDLVHQHFYDVERIPRFDAAIQKYMQGAGAQFDKEHAIRIGLAALASSHTEYYTPDELDYYELMDIFAPGLTAAGHADQLKQIFPPDGKPSYEGIGISTKASSEGRYVSDIYDTSPAAKSGLNVGDVIIEVDHQPFHPINSFKGKAGERVRLTRRQVAGGTITELDVSVVIIHPNELTDRSIQGSAHTFPLGDKLGGYLHLWTYTTPDTQELVQNILSSGPLKGVNGLVLDIRSRHGGGPFDAAETFVGRSPEIEMKSRVTEMVMNYRFRKPLVLITDEGTRSGLEILAYSLKRAGVPIVGSKTAGAVVGGQAFILQDKALLYLAVMDAHLDGTRLEGVGVCPTITSKFEKLYSGGHDPQLITAKAELKRLLDQG